MKSEFVGQEKNRVEIKVEFEASEFEAELKKVFGNISQRANIPGFRKGHIPRKTIEMRIGKNAIHEETIENLLNENISEIMKDYDIEPIFAPSVKSRGAVIDGQPVSVNLLIEARPEIKLPEFGEIEVERLITVVDDVMINNMIDNLRKSQSKIEAVDTPVQDDSIVTVEFDMAIIGADGTEVSRNKKTEMATLNMQELPMEEFREPLIGKSAGDSTEVTIKGQVTDESSEHPRTSMHYEMKIVEIGKRVLPELTPEFFNTCMGFECPTEDDFRDAIADRMLKKLQKDAEADAEARAVNIVAEMAGFEVPGSLIYREMERIKANDEKDAKERYKMEFKDLLKLRGMEYEEYEKQTMYQAWRIVRSMLVIDEIGRKFDIKIDPPELEEWIKNTAEKDGLDFELMKKAYFKDKDTVNILVDRVLSDKAIKLLMDSVKIKDVSELTQPVEKAENFEKPEQSEEPVQSEESEETENPEETRETKKTKETKKANKTDE
ncbi:MAG: trigger factor [Synergistaceae bacterium]|nr:trigger factor [Synergistaceae bacterium]